MTRFNINIILLASVLAVLAMGCSKSEGNNAGTEYMPDMYHSIAYEANLDDYYYYNTWDSRKAYYELAEPRKPVSGTIPRGALGLSLASKSKRNKIQSSLNGVDKTNTRWIPVNGSVPYYYADTEEERVRATNEIIENPFPITNAGLESAKPLYETYCGICHGNKGDGLGYLVADENKNAKYPAAPANFLKDEFVQASNGRYYHAIIHGKNVMGGYADKLSYEERWQVIHYIRSLQAKNAKLKYDETMNELNTVDIPLSVFNAPTTSVEETTK